ncbi:MAG: SDR family oxidoreductase [Gemmatimonadota bacterium]|nr:MAG: SDR family oxidoreductase [Gemmatimonadota bacterium]
MVDAFRLDGKVALVTGASRGLGMVMTEGLAEAGADIVAVATRLENLEGIVETITKLGKKSIPMACDVTDHPQVKKVVERTVEEFGRIDILLNCAGVIRRSPAEEFSYDDWNAVLDVNLNGTFLFCKEVGKVMLKQKRGKIINIASLLSFFGGITIPAYAASKGGVAQLTKALSNEWAAHGITVNAIAPGYYVTDMTEKLRENEVRFKEISDRIPAGRWGKPEDLKGAVVFLASEASDYVSGHILVVDGGWMAR